MNKPGLMQVWCYEVMSSDVKSLDEYAINKKGLPQKEIEIFLRQYKSEVINWLIQVSIRVMFLN